jgi:nucleoside phosphorylase
MSDRTNSANSCKSILHFMKEIGEDPSAMKTRALFQDLAWKAQFVDRPHRAQFVDLALSKLVHRTLQSLGCADLVQGVSPAPPRKEFDVGLITIVPVELKAVLVAFGGRPEESEKEDLSRGAERYWFRSLRRKGKRSLLAVITVVGQSRNVPCAIATERLVQTFSAKTLILVGIAAGLKTKVRIGDVVAAERVIDYEHVRQELTTLYVAKKRSDGRIWIQRNKTRVTKRRPLHIMPASKIGNDLSVFTPNPRNFVKFYRRELRKFDVQGAASLGSDCAPKYYKGTIASGEKLIADGSLVDLRLHFDERLRAADQDSSGFAQACQLSEPQIPWAVFRGVSDYGTPAKKDGYQQAAAVAAACAAVLFLNSSYR